MCGVQELLAVKRYFCSEIITGDGWYLGLEGSDRWMEPGFRLSGDSSWSHNACLEMTYPYIVLVVEISRKAIMN